VTLASALSMPLHYNVDKLSEIDRHYQAETLNETLTTLSGVGTSCGLGGPRCIGSGGKNNVNQ